MNPHLEYGQAIRGRCDGRGIGIIDTTTLIGVVHAVSLLSRADGRSNDVLAGVRVWFSEYLTWLTESKKGRGRAGHDQQPRLLLVRPGRRLRLARGARGSVR